MLFFVLSVLFQFDLSTCLISSLFREKENLQNASSFVQRSYMYIRNRTTCTGDISELILCTLLILLKQHITINSVR